MEYDVLVGLEPIVTEKETEKQRVLRNTPKGHLLTEEEVREVERQLWGKDNIERPRRVVQLGRLWKDVLFDGSSEDSCQVRQELFVVLKRRAQRL